MYLMELFQFDDHYKQNDSLMINLNQSRYILICLYYFDNKWIIFLKMIENKKILLFIYIFICNKY